MTFLGDVGLVFGRYFGLLMRNPVWVALGVLQPLLHAARHVFNDNLGDPSVAKGVLIMVVLSVIAVFIGARQFGRAIA